MSEAIAGIPPAPSVLPVREAAVALVYRRQHTGLEVFWLEREQRLSFAGGFFAFPGGKVDPQDSQLMKELGSEWLVAAARELFEETGILKTRGPFLSQETRDVARRALLNGRPFAEILGELSQHLFGSDFVDAGRWLTPHYVRVRFDTRFFLVEAPAEQHATVWPGELTSGEWIRPSEALARWEAGTALLHPPTLHALQVMAAFKNPEQAAAELSAPRWCEQGIARHIEFQRGIHLVPLQTLTLPPATHTNAFILGTRELLIVDPGAVDEQEVEKLVTIVRELESEGCVPKAIVVTHHHGDHIGGLRSVAARLKLPVWAHARTADRLPVSTERFLRDGDCLELAGPLPMKWKVLHTPDHAAGHVCLVDERSRAGIVGDMVSTVSTIVIDPPEGDMAVYVSQLERLRSLPLGALYPSHGPAVAHGVAKLEEYVAHRAWRENKVLEAVRSSALPLALPEVVKRAYDDVDSFVWPIAERTTVAILQKLVAESRVLATPEGQYLAA